MKTKYVMSKNNFSETFLWLKEKLIELQVEQREIFTTQLLLEENFLQMEKLSEQQQNFSAQVYIQESFGRISVKLTAIGKIYYPSVKIEDMKEDDEDYARTLIIQAHRKRLRYSHINGENIVTIRVHKSNITGTQKTILGLVLGIILGVLFKEFLPEAELNWIEINILNAIQTMFLNALIMVTAPMIFFSVLAQFSNMSDTAYIGRIGGKLLIFSLPKLAFYVALGLFAGYLIGGIPQLTVMVGSETITSNTDNALRDLIVGIVPNDIVTPFHTNNILQMLFIACFFGMIMSRAGQWAAWGRDCATFFSRFFTDVIGVIVPFIPLVVMVSMMKLMLHTGFSALIPYTKLIIATAAGSVLSILISSAIVSIIGKISPVPFIKKLANFYPLPFSLSDSTVCMPATMSFCHEKLGIDKQLTNFSIPVGMQLNMEGTAYYVAIISMMLAHTFSLDIDFEFLVTFFIAQFIISLTGVGLIAMPTLFASFGIPEIAIMMVIGIEPILDMFGTAHSVAGNITSTTLVSIKENKIDKKIYAINND